MSNTVQWYCKIFKLLPIHTYIVHFTNILDSLTSRVAVMHQLFPISCHNNNTTGNAIGEPIWIMPNCCRWHIYKYTMCPACGLAHLWGFAEWPNVLSVKYTGWHNHDMAKEINYTATFDTASRSLWYIKLSCY